jgi:hypothetical protein
MNPPVHPQRVEPTLLSLLRAEFPDVEFGSLRSRGNPAKECVIVGEPQGMCTPISQYVRLRVSVIVRLPDSSGDVTGSQRLAGLIISELTSGGATGPVISVGLESGPMRVTDDQLVYAYAILLLTVKTTE